MPQANALKPRGQGVSGSRVLAFRDYLPIKLHHHDSRTIANEALFESWYPVSFNTSGVLLD